jgi:hypothetical protein
MGQVLLIIQASPLHSDKRNFVRFLWTSDQPDAETSILQHITLTRDLHAPAGFETTIPETERLQIHALDCTTTGIGLS